MPDSALSCPAGALLRPCSALSCPASALLRPEIVRLCPYGALLRPESVRLCPSGALLRPESVRLWSAGVRPMSAVALRGAPDVRSALRIVRVALRMDRSALRSARSALRCARSASRNTRSVHPVLRLYIPEWPAVTRGCLGSGRRSGSALVNWTVATGFQATWIIGWNEAVAIRRSVGILLCTFLRTTTASGGAALVTLPSTFSLTQSLVFGITLDVLWWFMEEVAVTMLQNAVATETSVASKHRYTQWTFHRLLQFLVHISAVKTTEQFRIITSAVISVVTVPNLIKMIT